MRGWVHVAGTAPIGGNQPVPNSGEYHEPLKRNKWLGAIDVST